jgi:hypothetical protein
MNERGLAVGLAADDAASLHPDPAKPTVGSVRIRRLVLDQAARWTSGGRWSCSGAWRSGTPAGRSRTTCGGVPCTW